MVPLAFEIFHNFLLHLIINLKITQKRIHRPPFETIYWLHHFHIVLAILQTLKQSQKI